MNSILPCPEKYELTIHCDIESLCLCVFVRDSRCSGASVRRILKKRAAHRAALMRRPVKRSVVTDTAFLFLIRFALIRTHYEPAFGPVHIRFRRGMLLSTTRTSSPQFPGRLHPKQRPHVACLPGPFRLLSYSWLFSFLFAASTAF